jgi:integrase
MPEPHSSPAEKPAKPSADFPLFAHASGRWCKKVNGKLRYFGPWDNPDGALQRYLDFAAGKPVEKTPRPPPMGQPRPEKPSPDFPLFPHATGRWAKKIRGQLHYFGPWDDPEGALDSYNRQRDDLHAGRKPRPDAGGLTVKELCNAFLNFKKGRVDTGELSARSWADYKEITDLLVSSFGKLRLVSDLRPDDFTALREKMARRWGPVRLGNTVQRVRSVFKYAADSDLIDRPVRFGADFSRPSAKTLRLHRAGQGAKLFTADEVRRMIATAGQPLKAMLLLGINCGFGMSDCGRLPVSVVDLDRGIIDFPRPKTGIPRRCLLWEETTAALREALAQRHEPKDSDDADLAFITAQGRCWHKEKASSPMVFQVTKLLRRLGINGRKGLGFYTLRHTYRTVADEAKDQPATDYSMGHEVAHMSSVYREKIGDDRLRAIANHVRDWLFGVSGAPAVQ